MSSMVSGLRSRHSKFVALSFQHSSCTDGDDGCAAIAVVKGGGVQLCSLC